MSQILGVQELREIVPVRPGMHLLDKVLIESETKAWGMKGLSMGENFFMGHFPNQPIFPGVLQLEATAQLAEVLVWKKLDPERKGDIFLKSLRRVKFRKPNLPGDRILIELEITSITDDTAEFTANISNSSGIATNLSGSLGVRAREKQTVFPMEFNEFDRGRNLAMDTDKIQSILPHRYPFLFVDYVAKTDGSMVTGIKNCTETEPIFREYKDGYTVLLSSVQPEITAQVGAVYSLSRPAAEGKIALFMGIDSADFTSPVYPGDQLLLEVDMPDIKSRFGKGEGHMLVNGKEVSRTVMMFALVDKA
ncbi:MAG: hypothetical protein J6S53_04250 [Lentisphaeria bacterium]|nr:hypothetical protein [Lentisphaeria bacterium]